MCVDVYINLVTQKAGGFLTDLRPPAEITLFRKNEQPTVAKVTASFNQEYPPKSFNKGLYADLCAVFIYSRNLITLAFG